MNICAKCVHVVRREVGTPREFSSHNWRCGCPRFHPIPTLDPVTGRSGYLQTNDFGGRYFVESTDEAMPTCANINRDGNCLYYAAAREGVCR